jgi:hypothetical protein
MDLEQKIAEVIETSNQEFLAQCHELEGVPPLGSMVRTRGKDCDIYGIVYYSATHSIEPGRRIIARGHNAVSDEDVFKANPQLARLLCSDFKALVIGYLSDGAIRQYLPPTPAPVYAFVYMSSDDEVRQFTQSLNFLNLLLDSRLPVATDEVIAAFLRYASRTHPSPQDFLIKAGKELAWLLSNDIRRLDSILKRLSQ